MVVVSSRLSIASPGPILREWRSAGWHLAATVVPHLRGQIGVPGDAVHCAAFHGLAAESAGNSDSRITWMLEEVSVSPEGAA